jgi:hypothetical protein
MTTEFGLDMQGLLSDEATAEIQEGNDKNIDRTVITSGSRFMMDMVSELHLCLLLYFQILFLHPLCVRVCSTAGRVQKLFSNYRKPLPQSFAFALLRLDSMGINRHKTSFRYCNLLPHLCSIAVLGSGMDMDLTIEQGTGRGPLSRVQVCNLNPAFRSPRRVEKYQVQVTNLNPQESRAPDGRRKKGGTPPPPPGGAAGKGRKEK